MKRFHVLSDFLSDKFEMNQFLKVYGKELEYIFRTKNKQLQGANKTLIDAKVMSKKFIWLHCIY